MPPLINLLRNGPVNRLDYLKQICEFLGIDTSKKMTRVEMQTAMDDFILIRHELEPQVREMIEKINSEVKKQRIDSSSKDRD